MICPTMMFSARGRRTSCRFLARAGTGLLLLLLAVTGGVARQAVAQANSCAATTHLPLIAKYEVNGQGHFVLAEGTAGIISIANVQTKPGQPAEPISAVFTSTVAVGAVYVKAGRDSKTDTYTPGVFAGAFDNGGLGNNQPAISTVSFCEGDPTMADLEVAFDASNPAYPEPGDLVDFRVKVRNNTRDGLRFDTGGRPWEDHGFMVGTAENVKVKVYVPTFFTFVSATGGTYSPSNDPNDGMSGTIMFNLGDLPLDDPLGSQVVVLTFVLEVDARVPTNTPATIAAEVMSCNVIDPDSEAANLSVTPVGGPPPTNIFPNTVQDDEDLLAFASLPVELVAFEAQLDGRVALLRWKTASETNNAGFEIQHYTGDEHDAVWASHETPQRETPQPQASTSWESVAYVEGHGTTERPQTYAYRLEALAPGTHRFRLKQVDYDGTFEYSPEVEVTVDMPEAFVVEAAYPNPFNPETTLRLGVRVAQQVDVVLYNMLGQRVLTVFHGTLPAGVTHELRIDAGTLHSGTYVVRVEGEQFVDTQLITLVK